MYIHSIYFAVENVKELSGRACLAPLKQGIEKKALQAIADMEPQRIVYISYDPATMARDVNFLHYRGYELKEVQPVDMFPQTRHVVKYS